MTTDNHEQAGARGLEEAVFKALPAMLTEAASESLRLWTSPTIIGRPKTKEDAVRRAVRHTLAMHDAGAAEAFVEKTQDTLRAQAARLEEAEAEVQRIGQAVQVLLDEVRTVRAACLPGDKLPPPFRDDYMLIWGGKVAKLTDAFNKAESALRQKEA